MNEISEQLLQAVEIITDSKVAKLQYDKTIKAKIFSIIDLDTGEYKVRYNGNIFSVYAQDLKASYKVDEWVYVTVPEGNFSNRKIITATVQNQSLSQNQLMALQNMIFEISPGFNELYGGLYDKKKSWGVIAGAPSSSANSSNYIYRGPANFQSSGFHGLFQQYSNNYELIRIQADFYTQFQSIHSKGNYGIEVEFYAKGEEGKVDVVSYKLDLTSFNGDPYRLSVPSPQSVVIKVQKNYLLGLKSIKLFEEGFEYDRILENGQITNKKNTTEPNIFVENIVLQYVEQKDLSDTNYYLMIAAPQGIAFTNTISQLKLVGRLVYQGKDIIQDATKNKTITCQWFKRDLTVMIGEADYNAEVGFGWRPLPQTSNSLALDVGQIVHQQRYKLLVHYNNVVLTAEIEVFNHRNDYDYFIEQQTNGADISLLLNNKLNDKDLVGDWFLSYPDGSYYQVDDGKKKNSISVSQYLKYSSVTFYCQVYDYNKTKIAGTIEHTIVNSESDEDVTITYTGEDTFRYDANGDITIEDSEKERTLKVNLAWKEGFGTAYSVAWFYRDANGKEITVPVRTGSSNPVNPPNSMINELWVDNYNILHYNIKQKYKINFQNNTLLVKIKTITEQEYRFDKEILFLKDGDQGTNGTTYIIAIRPYDKTTLLKLNGFNPIMYNRGWKSNLPLRCYVYKDGELISDGRSSYDISYKWTGINISFTEHTGNDISSVVGSGKDRVTANGKGNLYVNSSTEFYVKVQVTINDKINNRETEVYASYPIDVVYYDSFAPITSTIDISAIPSYIKYTSSGLTPQFYNNDLVIKDNDNKIPMDGILTSMTPELMELTQSLEGLYYLNPATNFIFENNSETGASGVAVLRCDISSLVSGSSYIFHTIIMYLDTYGNEAINGWDGTSIETEDGHIFAPQIGAGEKNSANQFTGVVMGKDSGQRKIGLYGYQDGVNVFGLMANGKAYFGAKAGGGQIVLDGRYATLFGGNVTLNESSGKITPASNGMYIRLADKNPSATGTKAIGIGWSTHKDENGSDINEENFFVTYNGKMRATEANIHGVIYANKGQIGGTARQGGWTIELNRLYSGKDNTHVELNSDQTKDYAIWAGKTNPGTTYTKSSGTGDDIVYGDITNPAPFVVTRDGFVYAKNIRIKGHVEATSGKIANWEIKKNYLQDTGKKVGMASSGNAAFWAGSGLSDSSNSISEEEITTKFLVTRSGKLYCASAQVSGKITAKEGKIGNWHIRNNRLENDDGSVILSPTGLTLGNFYAGAAGNIRIKNDSGTEIFKVSNQGKLECTDVDITGDIEATNLSCEKGWIGGWQITKTTLQKGQVTLNSSTGTISGAKISGSAITGGSISIGPENGVPYFTADSSGASIRGGITATSMSAYQITIYNSNKFQEGSNLGTIGYTQGDDRGDALGIDGSAKVIIKSNNQIALRPIEGLMLESQKTVWVGGTNGNCPVYITGTELNCTKIDKQNQKGIYARFA